MSKSDIEAVNGYRKAAEHGDAEAAYNLGMSYLSGRGVLKDVYKARNWLGKSAMGGYYQASKMIAKLNQQQREFDQQQRDDYNKISPGALFLCMIIGGIVVAATSNDSDDEYNSADGGGVKAERWEDTPEGQEHQKKMAELRQREWDLNQHMMEKAFNW